MPYSESELVLPALEALLEKGAGGAIGTSELGIALRERLKPSGADLRMLKGCRDDHFSQKVRNLVSHDTLREKELATTSRGARETFFRITREGVEHCRANSARFDYLIDQGFSDDQRRRAADADFRDIVIEEGALRERSGRVYERSRRLSDYARGHFRDATGRTRCAGCGFEGTEAYGEGGLGLIHIHHTRPPYLRGGEGEAEDLKSALKGLAPLCPNCRRLVHRIRPRLMGMPELRRLTGYTPR